MTRRRRRPVFLTERQQRMILMRSGIEWWVVGRGVLGDTHARAYMRNRADRRRFITTLGPTATY